MMLRKLNAYMMFFGPRKNPLGFLGAVIVIVISLTAVLAPLIAPYDPFETKPAERLRPPSKSHPFGTDELGRDIFTRTLFGARVSLYAALVIISISFVFGSLLGVASALAGGWIDNVFMRFTDAFLAFPYLTFAMLISAVLGPSLQNAMIAISITWWPWYARLARAQVLAVKNELYIEAARAIGVGRLRFLLRYLLPNAFSPLIVQATLDVGYAILLASSLSFIGLGAQPPTPEWGRMVASGRLYLLTAWWVPLFPGLAIFFTVLGFNLIGDAVRDFVDPRTRQR